MKTPKWAQTLANRIARDWGIEAPVVRFYKWGSKWGVASGNAALYNIEQNEIRIYTEGRPRRGVLDAFGCEYTLRRSICHEMAHAIAKDPWPYHGRKGLHGGFLRVNRTLQARYGSWPRSQS